MNIVVLDSDTLGDLDLTPLKEYGNVTIYPYTEYKDTIDRCKSADIALTNKVVFDKDILDALPNLKLISVLATGMNNIDLNYAQKKGVIVKNVSGYSTNSVVQTTFMLALALIGKLEYYSSYTREGRWSKSPIFTNLEHNFFEIAGKKWGIIGLGTIGSKVAAVAKAFGAELFYYSTNQNPHLQEYKHLELNELLQECDIISIHAPLNEKTDNLIDKEQLFLLKDGAVLLNLGRGAIVNEAALAEAIDSKNLLVGLDVTAKEPIEPDNPLLNIKKKENLIITPHIAWGSQEAREALLEGTIANIKGFLNA